MATLKLVVNLVFFILLLNGCVRDEVAMNLYDPNSGDVEVISGVTATITPDMIKEVEERKRARAK